MLTEKVIKLLCIIAVELAIIGSLIFILNVLLFIIVYVGSSWLRG
jgi:hypothetical protein